MTRRGNGWAGSTRRQNLKPSGTGADYRDATSLDEAIDGLRQRAAKRRLEKQAEREVANRAKVTLSSAFDAWLKKDEL